MRQPSRYLTFRSGNQYEWRKQIKTAVWFITCMAPRFSVSCSGLDVPRRTELTPSFLRHHAGNNEEQEVDIQSAATGWHTADYYCL